MKVSGSSKHSGKARQTASGGRVRVAGSRRVPRAAGQYVRICGVLSLQPLPEVVAGLEKKELQLEVDLLEVRALDPVCEVLKLPIPLTQISLTASHESSPGDTKKASLARTLRVRNKKSLVEDSTAILHFLSSLGTHMTVSPRSKRPPCLLSLDLSGIHLGYQSGRGTVGGVEALAKILGGDSMSSPGRMDAGCAKLQALALGGCSLDDRGLEVLLPVLMNGLPRLTRLSLRNNGLVDSELIRRLLKRLLDRIPRTCGPLLHLDVSGNPKLAGVIPKVCDVVRRGMPMRSLKATGMEIDLDALVAIAWTLQQRSSPALEAIHKAADPSLDPDAKLAVCTSQWMHFSVSDWAHCFETVEIDRTAKTDEAATTFDALATLQRKRKALLARLDPHPSPRPTPLPASPKPPVPLRRRTSRPTVPLATHIHKATKTSRRSMRPTKAASGGLSPFRLLAEKGKVTAHVHAVPRVAPSMTIENSPPVAASGDGAVPRGGAGGVGVVMVEDSEWTDIDEESQFEITARIYATIEHEDDNRAGLPPVVEEQGQADREEGPGGQERQQTGEVGVAGVDEGAHDTAAGVSVSAVQGGGGTATAEEPQ
ncbi:unnamed protein product [Vitrella brassicaformis CCMP3155]|uniref:Uncharacterized protein n=3 Tax=Vitrella brassicaformis TaxID=1169539 RepID=A0A0G4EFV6_VITBC|nr:unnamed protein product [Vitrella brassicaformis CCMP3155]|eukprot:CEL94582.1 unnamed protein product [Vitrella brassicaformis CCMP3155]